MCAWRVTVPFSFERNALRRGGATVLGWRTMTRSSAVCAGVGDKQRRRKDRRRIPEAVEFEDCSRSEKRCACLDMLKGSGALPDIHFARTWGAATCERNN